jgi:hypothetical protein
MKYKLTSKAQLSKRGKDGKSRNFLIYFLNDIQIFKQKIPFDRTYERGFDRNVRIYDDYILNGKIHQKRRKNYGCSHPDNDKTNIREVSFPVSKKILAPFEIPKDLKIHREVR